MKTKQETIKSVTNCPLCKSEVTVEGTTTHYYVPVRKYTEEDLIDAMNAMASCVIDKLGNDYNIVIADKFQQEYIKQLNK